MVYYVIILNIFIQCHFISTVLLYIMVYYDMVVYFMLAGNIDS